VLSGGLFDFAQILYGV